MRSSGTPGPATQMYPYRSTTVSDGTRHLPSSGEDGEHPWPAPS